MTYNIQNDYGLEDPGFALLREVAQKYCPEELQAERQAIVPDEALDLSAIDLFIRSNPFEQPSAATNLPSRSGGVGGGFYTSPPIYGRIPDCHNQKLNH